MNNHTDYSTPKLNRFLPTVSLSLLVVFFLFGRLASGNLSWGFNHLAYLPLPLTLAYAVLAGVLLLPKVQAAIALQLSHNIPTLIFDRWYGRLIAVIIAGFSFFLLKEQSFFMGDGYLVADLVQLNKPFRAFDSMDYLAHLWTYQALGDLIKITASNVYQGGSIFAGILALLVTIPLIGRLDWEPWRKTTLLGFLFLSGPVALFFGYIESYSFLYVFLTCFLISCILALDKKAPVWLAGLFFGLALFFHLGAIFSCPALIILALRAPQNPVWRKWLEALLPSVLLLGLSVILHLLTGFDNNWLHKEYLDSANTRNLLVLPGGSWGFFSLYNFKMQFNLLLITAPACVIVILVRIKQIRQQISDPRFVLLLLQILGIVLSSLIVERKLGDARDWDLFVAHSAGLFLLASLLIQTRSSDSSAGSINRSVVPGRFVSLALTVTLLCSLPWIVLLHHEPGSVARITDVASGFPPHAKAYTFDGLGKYYRESGETIKAMEMYEQCALASPRNARFHSLLGSIYIAVANDKSDSYESRTQYQNKAVESYRQALRINVKDSATMNNLGRLLMQKKRFDEADDVFTHLVSQEPEMAEAWETLGFCHLQQKHYAESVIAFRQAVVLNPRSEMFKYLGLALMQMEQYEEAASAFETALMNGDRDLRTNYSHADCLISWAESNISDGNNQVQFLLDQAESIINELVGQNNNDVYLSNLQQRLDYIVEYLAR